MHALIGSAMHGTMACTDRRMLRFDGILHVVVLECAYCAVLMSMHAYRVSICMAWTGLVVCWTAFVCVCVCVLCNVLPCCTQDISLILSHPTIRDLSLLPDEQCDLSQDLSHHPCRLRRITLRNPTLSLLTHLPLQAVTESVTLASRFSYVTFNVPHDTTTQLARAVVSNCVSDHRPVRWDATWVAVVCGGVDTHTGTYTETESDTDLDGGSDAGTHRPVVQPHSAELLVILAPLWHGFQGPVQVQNAYVTVSVIEALSHCPVCEITWEECEFAPDAWAALLPRAPAAAARVTLRWRREWYETRDLARLFASSKAESHRSLCVRLECTSEKRWEEDAWDETVQEMIDKAHSESGGRVTFVLGEGDFNVM